MYGKYAWSVISKIIKYASSLVTEITDEFNDIDEAMRLGFNWTRGPFEMLEELGVKFFVEKDNQIQPTDFIKKIYEKTLKLAAHKSSKFFLAIIAFAESSFFPIPPDIMIVPMIIAKKNILINSLPINICKNINIANEIRSFATDIYMIGSIANNNMIINILSMVSYWH